jgi:putative transposase
MDRPALKRQAVDYIVRHYMDARRRACMLVRQHRSVEYYRSRKDPQVALRTRLRKLAVTRVRYGYRRLHILLRREGWSPGKDQACRPRRPNQAWSMDFVSDQLVGGTRIRLLKILDVFTREAIAIRVGSRMRAEQVVDTCNQLVARRGRPARVFVDNGSEFTGRLMDLWAYHHQVLLDFSPPGKPTENAFIESFNGSLRKECLNLHWFHSIDEAIETIEAWRVDYNESRPHLALQGMTPGEFCSMNRKLQDSGSEIGAGD